MQNIEITFKNRPPLHYEEASWSDPQLKPIFIVSGVSAVIFIFAPIFVRKGPNQGIIRWCIVLTVFSCWLLWVSIYLGQVNPLIGPRLTNTSLAWIGYCWGIDPKALDENKVSLSDSSDDEIVPPDTLDTVDD